MVATYYHQEFVGAMPHFSPPPYSTSPGVADSSDRNVTDKPTHTDVLPTSLALQSGMCVRTAGAIMVCGRCRPH